MEQTESLYRASTVASDCKQATLRDLQSVLGRKGGSDAVTLGRNKRMSCAGS